MAGRRAPVFKILGNNPQVSSRCFALGTRPASHRVGPGLRRLARDGGWDAYGTEFPIGNSFQTEQTQNNTIHTIDAAYDWSLSGDFSYLIVAKESGLSSGPTHRNQGQPANSQVHAASRDRQRKAGEDMPREAGQDGQAEASQDGPHEPSRDKRSDHGQRRVSPAYNLPTELWDDIFLYLNLKSTRALRLVSRVCAAIGERHLFADVVVWAIPSSLKRLRNIAAHEGLARHVKTLTCIGRIIGDDEDYIIGDDEDYIIRDDGGDMDCRCEDCSAAAWHMEFPRQPDSPRVKLVGALRALPSLQTLAFGMELDSDVAPFVRTRDYVWWPPSQGTPTVNGGERGTAVSAGPRLPLEPVADALCDTAASLTTLMLDPVSAGTLRGSALTGLVTVATHALRAVHLNIDEDQGFPCTDTAYPLRLPAPVPCARDA